MSDSALNQFLASGTAAERAAFTPSVPSPASGPDPLYFWYETDTTKTYAYAGGAWVQVPAGPRTFTIPFIIDGGGVAITTGVKGDLEIPVTCTITAVRLLADASGSIVVDIWKDSYANLPPTIADTITASAKPTLSAVQKSEDATLTGWTTSITAGQWLRFNVDSASTVTRVTLSLTCRTT